MDDEGESILQPNIQFAFLSALMGLQKEKCGSKIFQIGLWQENKGGKYSQFSSSLFLPFVICYGREIPLS